MIVVDTSALMAVVLGEPDAAACMDVLERETGVIISAVTLAEALIVAGRRGVASEMTQLVEGLAMEVAAVTASTARGVAEAYERWGKGIHSAALNFGDCYAYVEARQRACPLLYVGDDFAKTDVAAAWPAKGRTRRQRSRKG